MAEQLENNIEQSSVWLFFQYLLRKWLIILLVVIIGAGASYAVTKWKAKPEFVATHTLIFKTTISSKNQGDLKVKETTLAKMYLPTAAKTIKSPDCVAYANELFKEEGDISSSAISVNYGDESLIFNISCVSDSRDSAEKKLVAVIDAAEVYLSSEIEADNVELIPVQRGISVKQSSNAIKRNTVLGAVAGLVLACVILAVVFSLDNTIKEAEELEKLTGANFLAHVGQNIYPKYTKRKKSK